MKGIRRSQASLNAASKRIRGKTKRQCMHKGLYADWMADYRDRKKLGIKYPTRQKKSHTEIPFDAKALITSVLQKTDRFEDSENEDSENVEVQLIVAGQFIIKLLEFIDETRQDEPEQYERIMSQLLDRIIDSNILDPYIGNFTIARKFLLYIADIADEYPFIRERLS